jgi:type I restriction enzyme, S subunit
MGGEFVETYLGCLLSFTNGRSSPDRSDGLPYPVYGSNGVIGYANEVNADAGSIVIGRVGSYCGSLYLSKRRCWVTDNAIRAVARDDNDPRFLFYLLGTLNLNNWRAGSGQPLLNQDILSRIPAAVPEPPEQRAIADILGTLDDKIELNRRMNETLEATGRALFKSWFIDFDPVRAKVEGRDPGLPGEITDLFPDSFEDSEVGQIPEGWTVAALPEIINVNPTRALQRGALAPYLDMANMPTRCHSPDMVIDRPFGSGMRFVNGDTLVARITPCLENGKTAYVDFLEAGQVGWGSTEYIVLRPKPPVPEEFAYCLGRSDGFREFAIQSMTGTSGRQRVPAESLSHYRLVVPPSEVANSFGLFVRPLFTRSGAASRESHTLADLRDTLLPKLVSGEIKTNDMVHFPKGARL